MVPLILWAVHIGLAILLFPSLTGDSKMIAAFRFFALSGALMLILSLIAIWRLVKQKSFYAAGAVLLNLSWLYYLKVIEYGPTIGDL